MLTYINPYTDEYIQMYSLIAKGLKLGIQNELFEQCQNVFNKKTIYRKSVENLLTKNQLDDDPVLTLNLIEYLINQKINLRVNTPLPDDWLTYLNQ